VPMFVLAFLPPGVVGIVFIAVLSALMSSLDSAINSLSAVTMEDFYKVYIKPEATEKHYLRVSKVLTVFWGIFSIVAALVFAGISGARRQTTIVLINAVGSLLYGPILAAFLLGLTVRRIGPFHAFIGVLSGIITNILVWRLTEISWLWWNLTGFTSAALVALLMSFVVGAEVDLANRNLTRSFRDFISGWKRTYTMVMIYFFLIIIVAYMIQRIA
jgi:Na+/proline symporter